MVNIEEVAQAALEVDREVTHTLAAGHDRLLPRAAGMAAEVADQPPLVTLSIATALAGAVGRRPDILRADLRMLAAHALATGVKTLVKHRVDRTRPKRALREGDYRFEKGSTHDHELNSFPSGHMAGAVAVWRAAAHEVEGVGLPGAAVVGAVAAAQAPAGNHYFSDMVAGAAIGWASERLVGLAFDRVEWGRDRITGAGPAPLPR